MAPVVSTDYPFLDLKWQLLSFGLITLAGIAYLIIKSEVYGFIG